MAAASDLEPFDDHLLADLTAREREVLEQLAIGRLYKEVADHLGISMGTMNSHVEAIYRKLHVQTRAEAVLKLRPR